MERENRWGMRARLRLIACAMLLCGIAPLAPPSPLAVHAAPPTPNPAPTARDTSIPYEPSRTAQVGGQAVQVAPIRRVQTADGREAVADRLIVGFKPGVTAAEQDAVHRAVAARSRASVPNPAPLKRVGENAQYVDVTGAPSLDAAAQAYRADSRVRYAEPDYLVRTAETPSDPNFDQQYDMAIIGAPAAWDVTHGSANVKIAILDCGIYEAHPDLAGKVTARVDYTGSQFGTDDRCNHGTHVAGTASANTNNAVGVAGVGYSTSLLNAKVLLEEYDGNGNLVGGYGDLTWIQSGIRWAADNGAKVINMSLGGVGSCPQTMQDEIDYAWSKNVVIVAAAGNNGADQAFFPADCAHVVPVASTDSADARSSFSNYGAWVAVAAPGSNIYSTVNPALNNGALYGTKSGTSMATPHVAGLAALLWATSWGTTGAQAIIDRIGGAADARYDATRFWSYRRINAGSAVSGAAVPPALTRLSATTAVAGSSGFVLAAMGYNFVPGSVLLWNGVPHIAVTTGTTQLTAAVTAAGLETAGAVSVTVANPDGLASGPLAFTITPAPPRPTGIAPASGTTDGGTAATITGTYFQSGATVTVGGAAAAVLSTTGSAIAIRTPGHGSGAADVVVTNPDGQRATLEGAFTYIAPPAPRSGPTTPGTPITNPAPRPPASAPAADGEPPAPLPPAR